ncbi:TorF family putative porin [Acinetobacter sp. Ac_5812]|uniref:TorF family putative porin n=1 Tax=Acinetobacter sp. Ac_5812 TaxID=1848937 RepID=UPI0014907668|nr:TorF family putative porin [Acinetobacter sp. Ac_5812]NNP69121.1 hypothetical protein [Acinetobacter sp. Ac_5812]
MIKNTVMLAISTSAIFSTINVQAAETKAFKDQFAVSGSLAFLTEYYWRGTTQTQGKPAVQGTLRADHDSGLYAQLFASNIQLDIGSSIEFDYYLGYDYQFNDHLKLNLQYLDVNYPGEDKTLPRVDFEEYSIGLFASGLLNQQDQLNLSFYYSPDYTLETGKMLRYEVGYRYPVADQWHAYAQAAYNQFSSNEAYELLWATDEKKHFYDYKVGVDFNYQDFIFDLYYADANVNKALKNADSTVVFSLTRTF